MEGFLHEHGEGLPKRKHWFSGFLHLGVVRDLRAWLLEMGDSRCHEYLLSIYYE